MTTSDKSAAALAPATVQTLIDGLAQQALLRGHTVALRQKRLGLWHAKSWREVVDEVAALAAGLSSRGFGAGDRLLVASHPRAEALLIALAAQWLGGSAALVDPAQGDAQFSRIVAGTAARHLFAEDQQQVDRVLAALGSDHRLSMLAYADRRGLAEYAARHHGDVLVAYDTLVSVAAVATAPVNASASQIAFQFLDLDEQGRVVQWPVTHYDSLKAGRELIDAERLGAHEVALAARGFTAGGHARYLIAPWLLAGFSLNFPENLSTRDQDRRELGPTLVAGTRATYARLAALVRTRLPAQETLTRRLLERVLESDPARGLLAALVRRALRDVIGFTRVRAPLLVGDDIDPDTRRFFSALGIAVRHWPEPQAAVPVRDGVATEQGGSVFSGLGVLPGLHVQVPV